MEKKPGPDLNSKQPLYGVFNAAMQSNDVEQMKTSADHLRTLAASDPSLQPKIDELDAAISKLSADK